MVINISEIISTTGKAETYSVNIDMDTLDMNGNHYAFIEKAPVTLTIANTGNRMISMEGNIKTVVNIPCDRCLEDVPVTFDIDVCKEIDFKSTDEERIQALDETSYIDHSELDIDMLVYNEIFVHFPMKTLCREDCKGLCLKCGHNLNKGECGCDRESLDPRMSAIRDIFNNFKEV